jgi:plasmid stabilization system protein ParE
LRTRVVWSPLALRRAGEAAQFIAQDDPAAAERWARGLFDAVRGLGRFPRGGRVVPELGRPEIREILYRNHRVVYRHSSRLVEVLTVRHGRRRFAPAEVVEPQ